jgi:hypothetical protein
VGFATVAVLVLQATFSTLVGDRTFWPAPCAEAAAAAGNRRQDGERLLMAQPALIDAALEALAPRSGDTSVYVVGFAGVGEQRVFAGEIDLATKIFGVRYGATQRSIELVNDRRDLESRPLATVTGLRRTLDGVGRRMDVDRDVLILIFSSHGSDPPAISVSNSDLPLQDLKPGSLKDALAASGIKWRVIVISACHAGAFIPYLADERTIVITAAAANRTSFGCSDDRDLTDFGETFFRDAVPSAATLRAAFESARKAIERRERKEHREPSEPAAYFGNAMEKKLNDLDRFRLETQPAVK